MDHTCLTWLIMQLNHCIDSGKYDSISVQEVYQYAKEGTIFQFLRFRLGIDFDGSFFKLHTGFEEKFSKYVDRMSNTYTGDTWGIHNKGLCQILAWANELLKWGSDWKPPKNVFDPL